ncbi:hypothetical protein RvY_11440 [Ramazzottius varieornatus]|uniref:Uncharacterized protein n=1 Tax=Ramazzottius varieornatus TaxID=947166 RepID=A0A1D1VG47_RAMVA|nr:hypothetical protein RvY_11440 [Ramazzottius varieornatus]
MCAEADNSAMQFYAISFTSHHRLLAALLRQKKIQETFNFIREVFRHFWINFFLLILLVNSEHQNGMKRNPFCYQMCAKRTESILHVKNTARVLSHYQQGSKNQRTNARLKQ